MSKIAAIIGIVYIAGYLICLIITTLLLAFGFREEEYEEGYIPGVGGAILVAAFISIFWVAILPMYILALFEE